MFTKEEKSSFSYWFAHWCAFQMTALNLHHWRFKYLFHDFEKPWLKLVLPYDKVKRFHRNHADHHITYFIKHGNADWQAMLIDWECCRFTKIACPLNAEKELIRVCDEIEQTNKYGFTKDQYKKFIANVWAYSQYLGLDFKANLYIKLRNKADKIWGQ